MPPTAATASVAQILDNMRGVVDGRYRQSIDRTDAEGVAAVKESE
ncbi:MAG TPA: hypothetical protein VJW73_19510 [Gemmatimonadaceae bacterium]|nr:hypothetical protein [Gemmatimonadaceae bacterium]